MSDDAIHNPSAATNEQTETTMKEIVNQPKVTEGAGEGAHESAANPLLGNKPGDQTNEAHRMHARGRGRVA